MKTIQTTLGLSLSLFLLSTLTGFAQDLGTGPTIIPLEKSILDSGKMEFIPFQSADPTEFGNFLSLNIEYRQIKKIRELISERIGRKLTFNKRLNPKGEAHVTTITPPEFVFTLRHGITMDRINQIAHDEMDIQSADLKVLGIGSGSKVIESVKEETFYLIADSAKLRAIRHAIYEEFISSGGDPAAFDPAWFFPHITIGFTKKDLHEDSGLLKNIKKSYDARFKIEWVD